MSAAGVVVPFFGLGVPAPELTRTSAAATNPPAFLATFVAPSTPYTDFTRENDKLCVDWSTDPYFLTGVTTVKRDITTAVITAGSLAPYGWGALSLASAWHFRFWIERAGQRVSPYSATHRWNDSVGPSIAAALATVSNPERTKLEVQIVSADVSDPLASFRITGGTDAAQFLADGLYLRWVGDGVKDFEVPADGGLNNVYDLLIRGTDLAGNEGPEFAIAVGVTDRADTMAPNPAQPPIANATEGGSYPFNFTVNNYTAPTTPGPLIWTGPWPVTKNGVPITSPSTFQQGDAFSVAAIGPAANVSVTQPMNFDGTILNLSVAGPLTMPQAASLGMELLASDTTKLFKIIAGGGGNQVTADGDRLGQFQDRSAAGRHVYANADDNTRPIWRTSGGISWVDFDGIGNVMRGAIGSDFLCDAGAFTTVLATRGTGSGTFKWVFGEGNTADGDTAFCVISQSQWTAGTLGGFLRNDANVQQVSSSANWRSGVWDGADTIIIAIWDGTTMSLYEDASTVATATFTPVAPMTVNRVILGALGATGVGSFFAPFRLYGLWAWPGIQLNSTERAQARTTAAATQGRSL